MKLNNKFDFRRRRHLRLRKKVSGTAERPRMAICVTGSHMYVQFVDDACGSTLVAASTLKKGAPVGNNVAAASALGKTAAEAALGKGIKTAVFDRGGHKYIGRVKAVAEAARAAGLKI